jgi:replication factor C subunit 1
MISTTNLGQTALNFDQGKSMSKAWETCRSQAPGHLSQTSWWWHVALSSKATLNDKIELYFNGYELSYLMIQENYLSTKPSAIGTLSGASRL